MRQPMISSCAVSWCRFVIPWADRVVPRWRARLIVLGVLASCVVGTISRAGDPPAEGPSTTAFTTGDSGAADAINPAPAADANVQASSLYTEHVKPLFAEKCISCHGPVEQEAGLRLDAGSLIHEADKASSLLTPSDPASSELLIRVSDPDEHARMPPPGEGTSLTESERETLRRWIAAGGPFPEQETYLASPQDHWAFQPLSRRAVPQTSSNEPGDGGHGGSDSAGGGHPIDAFLQAIRNERGTRPLRSADRDTWLRRVTLNLTGLPPVVGQRDRW